MQEMWTQIRRQLERNMNEIYPLNHVWIQPPSSRRHLAKPLSDDQTRQNNI